MNPGAVPIPSYDHLALPGGAGLILALMVAFGWLAWLLLGATLGGTLLAFFGGAAGFPGPVWVRTRRVLPVLFLLGLALAVLPAIGALLLYGQYYLTVATMSAYLWVAATVVMLLVFVLLGWAGKTRHRFFQVAALGLGAIFLLALFFFVAHQHHLAMNPEIWWALHHYGQGWTGVSAPTLIQNAQDIAVALALAGILWGWVGRAAEADDPDRAAVVAERTQRSGMLAIAIGMVIAVGVDLWTSLVTITDDVRQALFDFAHPATWVWLAGVVLGMFAVFAALFDRKNCRPWFYWSSVATVLAVLGVLVGRFRLRDALLFREEAGGYRVEGLPVAMQAQATYFFIATLMVVLILVSAMLWMVFARHKVVQKLPHVPQAASIESDTHAPEDVAEENTPSDTSSSTEQP